MLEKYARYTVEDFVKDEQFVTWVKLYPHEVHNVWHQVVNDYPVQAETIALARQIVLHLDKASASDPIPGEAEEIWSEIENAIDYKESVRTRIFASRWFQYAAAASIFVLMFLGWWKYSPVRKQQVNLYTELINTSDTPLEEVINGGEQPMLVKLDDGSTIKLDGNSKLSYSKDFQTGRREVFLSGGAFFDVTKDPARPFVVYANEVTTKVLGTSFSIRAFDKDQDIVVSVRTGKVSVFANGSKRPKNIQANGVTLIPNQQAIFSRREDKLSKTLVEQPQIVVSKQEVMQFVFTNAQVSSIFEALEKVYGIKIEYSEELLSGCRLTTSLSNETLYERLDVICEAIDATYKVVDGEVVISGNGCH
jgi:transmembrane sensor